MFYRLNPFDVNYLKGDIIIGKLKFGVSILIISILLSCKKDNPQSPVPTIIDTDGWKIISGAPQPQKAIFDDLYFVDANNGWICDNIGEVFNTTNGGETWNLLSKTDSVWFRCIGFSDKQRGWIGNINAGHQNTGNALYETLDGGLTWSNISNKILGAPVVGLCGINVISNQVIVAVGRFRGPAVFVKTSNGGQSWTSKDMSSFASALIDVSFFDELTGVAVGVSGDPANGTAKSVILYTADGGSTWQQQYLSAQVGEWCWKVNFPNRDTGYVTTEGPAAEGVVLKTVDGGKNWNRISVGLNTSPLEGVGFVTPDRGWVADSQHGFIISTSDGGKTWKWFQLGNGINRMRIINNQLVFASGGYLGAQIYKWAPQ